MRGTTKTQAFMKSPSHLDSNVTAIVDAEQWLITAPDHVQIKVKSVGPCKWSSAVIERLSRSCAEVPA